MYTRADDFFYMQAIERKAASKVWHLHGINRFELNMLASLSAYLRLQNKKIISRKIFTDWLGLGYKQEKKCWCYIGCLIRKGAIHRLAYRRPDGNSLAISEYGIKILMTFDQALAEIEEKNVKTRSFMDLGINLNTLPDGYILKQAGRDS